MTHYNPIHGPYIHGVYERASQTKQILGKTVIAYEVLGERDGLAHVRFITEPDEEMTLVFPID